MYNPRPRYCSKCGALTAQRKRVEYYYSHDGSPHFHVSFRCPNHRWWRRGHTNSTSCAAKSREETAMCEWRMFTVNYKL